jgi:hypothetical protein
VAVWHSCTSTILWGCLLALSAAPGETPGGVLSSTSDRDEQKWLDLKASDVRQTARSEALVWKKTKPDGF